MHQYKKDVVQDYVDGFGNAWTFIVAEGRGRRRTVRLNRVLSVTEAMAGLTQEGLRKSLEY